MDKITPRLTRRQIENKDIDINDLKLTLRVYSKAANTRLRSLEKAGLTGSPAYKEIKSYARDSRSFMATDKSGRFKFNTNTRGMDRVALTEELLKLHGFLFDVKTSTVSGAKEHKKKLRDSHTRYKKGKSKKWSEYFSNMSEDEFDQFWGYRALERVFKIFGSKVLINVIQKGAENPNIKTIQNTELALEEIYDDLETYSEMSLYRYVETYKPTGSVT